MILMLRVNRTLQGAWRLTFSAVAPRNLAYTSETPV